MPIISPPRPISILYQVVFVTSQQLTTIAKAGMTQPKGTLKVAFSSGRLRRSTGTARQVGRYWTKRLITEMAARVAKEPDRAKSPARTAELKMA